MLIVVQRHFVKAPVSTKETILRAEAFSPLTVDNFRESIDITDGSEDTSQIEYTARVISVPKVVVDAGSKMVFSPESRLIPRYPAAENDSIHELQHNFGPPVRSSQKLRPARKGQPFHPLLGRWGYNQNRLCSACGYGLFPVGKSFSQKPEKAMCRARHQRFWCVCRPVECAGGRFFIPARFIRCDTP